MIIHSGYNRDEVNPALATAIWIPKPTATGTLSAAVSKALQPSRE